MGDIIEITTTASHPFLYYKTNGNGAWFDVKTQSNALIGLGKECGNPRYWFEFSNPGVITFAEINEIKLRKNGQPFSINERKYSRFWVAWDCNSVWAGIGYSSVPFLVCPCLTEFNFITYTTKDPAQSCTFRFAVLPLCIEMPDVPSKPKILGGKLEWKDCDNQLPDGAVIGGYIDGEIVYVIRALHRLSLTPGVFIPSKGVASVPWGGSDNPTSNFQALCGYDLEWKAATTKHIPVDSLIAGHSEINREPLYIGRAFYQGHIIPGKVQLSHMSCYIAFQGREIAVKKFEVLTQPGLNINCANATVMRTRRNFDYMFNEGESDDERYDRYDDRYDDV